jgi:hypothetical protein
VAAEAAAMKAVEEWAALQKKKGRANDGIKGLHLDDADSVQMAQRLLIAENGFVGRSCAW